MMFCELFALNDMQVVRWDVFPFFFNVCITVRLGCMGVCVVCDMLQVLSKGRLLLCIWFVVACDVMCCVLGHALCF